MEDTPFQNTTKDTGILDKDKDHFPTKDPVSMSMAIIPILKLSRKLTKACRHLTLGSDRETRSYVVLEEGLRFEALLATIGRPTSRLSLFLGPVNTTRRHNQSLRSDAINPFWSKRLGNRLPLNVGRHGIPPHRD
jgi:hypothetical protein